MGDNLGPNGLSGGCKVFLFQIDIAEIVVHDADEPDAVIDSAARQPAKFEKQHNLTDIHFCTWIIYWVPKLCCKIEVRDLGKNAAV